MLQLASDENLNNNILRGLFRKRPDFLMGPRKVGQWCHPLAW
jgi:hypothetical protein